MHAKATVWKHSADVHSPARSSGRRYGGTHRRSTDKSPAYLSALRDDVVVHLGDVLELYAKAYSMPIIL